VSTRAAELVAQSHKVPRTPRLGFLGVGWIGRSRLDAVRASGAAEVAAAADPAAPDALDSYEELLAHDLDGVVIATPSALHAEQAIAALERGLAVFCQKPLGRTAVEAAAVVDAARAADRLLGVDFCYRHVAGIGEIRRLVRDGALGSVRTLDLVFHNAYGPDKPWFYDRKLSGGGCVIDLGTHLVDLALWLLDWPPVERVDARVLTLCGSEPQTPAHQAVEDYAVAEVGLRGGIGVRIACSWHLPIGRDAQIEAHVYGTRGGAHFENVGGSFYEFTTYVVHGREVQVLATPPDDWGGRAIVAWARRLAHESGFDDEATHAVDVARVVDAIYGHAQ
jgi:predicted dehydrogenase